MANYINKDRYSILKTALKRISNDKFDRKVDVEDTSLLGPELSWGVNWSCCGTQDANTAYDMANFLVEAANITSALNDMGLEMLWEDDKWLHRVLQESGRSVAKMEYDGITAAIIEHIENQDWDSLLTLLTVN